MVRNRIQSVFNLAMFVFLSEPACCRVCEKMLHRLKSVPPGFHNSLTWHRLQPVVYERPASGCRSSRNELLHQSLEFASAVLEILELIEAGAGRREEHGIANGGAGAGFRYRSFQRAATNHWRRRVQLR